MNNDPLPEKNPQSAINVATGSGPSGKSRFAYGILILFALVFVGYIQLLPGNFIMDDHRLVASDNPLVNGEFTPLNIWFQTDFTLSTFTFWLEWLAFGDHPAGYHLVNLLLHALSAVLLWQLLRQLKIPGAWLAGAIFAVHPVGVNSVARIAELKNTLSLPFFLLSFWAYLRYEATVLYREDGNEAAPNNSGAGLGWYLLAFLAFLLALLAKTSTVMLPLLLLCTAAWQRRRLTWRDVGHVLPFLVLASAFGLMSVWFQTHQALAEAGETLAPSSFATRLAAAGKVYWFYLEKDLLPVNLSLVYPTWKTGANVISTWLPLALIAVCLAICWRSRQGWGRHGLLILVGFGITLFPVLGLFDSQFLTRWQVSDHLQYLPLIIPVALVAAALGAWLNEKFLTPVSVTLLAILLLMTFQRAGAFATEEALMRDTLAKNPAAASAHDDLGTILARKQDFAGAMDQFTTAVQQDPTAPGFHMNLGQLLTLEGRLDEAEQQYLAAVKLRPNEPVVHQQYARVLTQQGRYPEAILQLQSSLIFQKAAQSGADTRIQLAAMLYQTGYFRRAAAQLQLAVQAETNSVDALNNLAWILATCPNPKVRNGAAAVNDAERACQLTNYKSPTPLSTLAAAYAEAGRFSEAVTMASKALEMQQTAGDTQQAAVNQRLLALYQAGQPFHEDSPADREP